jgi:hypothetical protein
VDNNYLDLGMNKSGFVHTLPSGRLSPWVRAQKNSARREGALRAVAEDDTGPDIMLHSELPITTTWRANCHGVRPRQIRKGATKRL